MTQIMGNKWDNLPNEVLAQIIEALGSAKNLNKEANKNLQRWAPVNKQWYDRFRSLKYKEITITLNNSDVLLQNIIQSSFLPGRWVKSITIEALCTMYNTSVPLGSDDPLNLLMTRCLNVKNVTLPQYMDDRSVGIYWRYFSNALVNNNTWKLQSLAVGNLTRPITFDSAKKEYFDCVHHLRSSIRQLVLTTGMVPSGCFRCLQEFQQLATLAIRERLIGNLTDLCGLMNHLPQQLEDIAAYFSTHYWKWLLDWWRLFDKFQWQHYHISRARKMAFNNQRNSKQCQKLLP